MEEQRQETTPQDEERAQKLYAQAEVIQRAAGIDVLDAFARDQSAQERVRRGEWDFADLARSILNADGVPSAARSANGAFVAGRDVRSMSQAEFDRLNEQLDRGYTFQAE